MHRTGMDAHLYGRFAVDLCVSLLSMTAVTALQGEFFFAIYYGDNMVLQRAPQQAVVWGYSPHINGHVTLQIIGVQELSTRVFPGPADLGGVWRFVLKPIEEPGPYNISVTGPDGTIVLKNVLFGDVWICSGQSNMQFSMGGVINSTEEIESLLPYDRISLFMATTVESFHPLYDLHKVDIPWTRPTVATVTLFSAVCLYYGKYLYDRLKRPLGLIEAAWGGTAIETWSSPEALTNCGSRLHEKTNPLHGVDGPIIGSPAHVPAAHCVLWNAMIHPLLNMTIYGVIWYQGESNVGMARFYGCAFPALIADWRRKFSATSGQTSPTFPFGFVQLGANNPHNIVTGFPVVRWYQTSQYGYVPNPVMKSVFMAVAMDLPDFDCPYGTIHPRHKKDVGLRLAKSGLAVAYNIPGVGFQGPFPTQITKYEAYIKVEYGGEEVELRTSSRFEVCCSRTPIAGRTCSALDPQWKEATVVSVNGSTLLLDSQQCCDVPVTRVRYAWRESPCQFKNCPIYGKLSDLPGAPFIFDVPMTQASTCARDSCLAP